jgi:hypothetical protein
MRRHRVVMVLAGAAAGGCAAPLAVTAAPAAGAAAQAGTGGTAIEVPGLGSLNQGGQARLTSVSCGSAGNCVAGGFYTDGSGHGQAFVVRETDGKWYRAIEVPRSAFLNAGGSAGVSSVSCASAGNCAALGYYTDGSGHGQAFVFSQTDGTWGSAIKLPGYGTLNKLGYLDSASVSCASAGNCSAVGGYRDGSSRSQVFVVSETNGTWATAIKMPSAGILNWGGSASVSSVSCGSAGNCAAGGSYRDRSTRTQAFVVNQTDGTWGSAIEVPGSEALNLRGFASVNSVSCVSAGNCTAAGFYEDSPYAHERAFTVREKDGTWDNAIKLPGSVISDPAAAANVTSVSCAAAGNCAAGGTYNDTLNHNQAFVASKRNGLWGPAIEVPGSEALNVAGFAIVGSLSCRAANNCTAGGFYLDGSDHEQVFVVRETNGTWGNAVEVPGSGALNAGGDARVTSVSCGSVGSCAVGGFYTDGSGHTQAFVASQA